MGCCHFANGVAVNREEYENAIKQTMPSDPRGVLVHNIPCRIESEGLQHAVETRTGFYPGAGMYQAFGMLVADGRFPRIYHARTDGFLREGAEADVAAWNHAWKATVTSERQRRGIE
jgi:hypothetical protein